MINSIYLIIATIIFFTIIGIYELKTKLVKCEVIILNKFENHYFQEKRKKLYKNKESISLNNITYILQKPTFFSNKRIPIYVFEKNQPIPLSFNKINEIIKEDLDILLSKNVIKQLVSHLGLNLNIFLLIFCIVFGVLLGYILGQIFPLHQPQLITNTTQNTITNTLTPIPRP